MRLVWGQVLVQGMIDGLYERLRSTASRRWIIFGWVKGGFTEQLDVISLLIRQLSAAELDVKLSSASVSYGYNIRMSNFSLFSIPQMVERGRL